MIYMGVPKKCGKQEEIVIACAGRTKKKAASNGAASLSII
jgi:hypothetical protein